MIKNFLDKETEKVWEGGYSKKIPVEIQRNALRKLIIINNAEILSDLNLPPGNKLEKLKGKLRSQMSVRINDKWRICFIWDKNNAHNVYIVDYH